MNTEYGYRKQVESHHQGSKHTLASLMSKLRSSLGAAWEQAGSSLEYAYSMLMTTFLRPFSCKRAELERRLVPDEITAHSQRDYGSSLTRLRLVVSILLLLTLGNGSVWGQTEITALSQITDANGSYVITHDISGGTPEVTTFNGTLEAAIDPETNMPYRITGLSAPLFTTLTGTVKNIVLEGVSISGNSGNTGAIACTANGAARIYNVGILSGSVGGSGNTGGLVGFLDGTARVINCYSFADITGGSNVAGIVGNNNQTSSQTALNTIVVNCMFYGNITGGTSVYPVYGGKSINNNSDTGINPYCYFRKNATLTPKSYNRSWPAEEKNLTRFEYYRSVLNSNRKLCTWWVNGISGTAPTDEDVANVGIAKWVLDPGVAPYPILKKWGKYPSVINHDPDKVWDPRTEVKEGNVVTPVTPHWVQRSDANEWEGKSYGTLAVTIEAGDHGSGSTSRNIAITDMDTLNCDYSYYKIQLPYYNEVFGNPNGDTHAAKYGGNYTEYVVTGWEITAAGSTTVTDYNFADRNSINGRVFAQGGYYYVPKDVTSITITARWGKAIYLSNRGYSIDRVNVTNAGYKADNAFAPAGTVPTTFQGQPVYADLQEAIKALGTNTDSPTVYDQAIVLIGNHQVKNGNSDVGYNLDSKWHPFTIMSADFDFDNEPDYSLQFQFRDNTPRPGIQPIRFDFLPVVELGLAVRHNNLAYAIGIFVPQGHFEVTETAFMRTTQFEYDGFNSYTDKRIETKSPVIINGGEYEMFTVRYHDSNRTSYFLLGGNAWIHRFAPGAHPSTSQSPKIYLCPINVIGGQVKELYLTGLYRAALAAPTNQGAPRCYTDGGKFDIMAGAGYDKVEAGSNVTFKINHSKITEFYGGGINGSNPISGDIDVTIDNSYVDKYCGGPKVGDMTGKTVTTHATGTTFGVFFGGGNGGNSYYRQLQKDGDQNSSHIGTWTDQGYNWNNFNPLGVKDDGTDNKGYHAEYEFEVFNHSNGVTDQITQRGFIRWIQFGITKTGNVSSTLSDCKILGNFYGGGNLATVDGNVTSTLTNTQVAGSVFGAGYSAAIPTFQVHDKDQVTFPSITAGVITDGHIGYDDKVYEWTNEILEGKDQAYMKAHPAFEKDGKWYCYTWNSLDGLGAVTGNVTLTLDNSTVGSQADDTLNKGNVFGGGEQSSVDGNTTVTIDGGNIYGSIFGGGDLGSVGTFNKDDAGKPTECTTGGKCTVEIKGAANIGHDGMTMPDDWGHIFGAGRGTVNPEEAAKVGGHIDHVAYVDNTEVTIGGSLDEDDDPIADSPLIKGSVYGGSENGHVLHGTKVVINSGQIGVGKNTTARYTAEQWSGTSLAPCASWTYEENGDVYDPYAPEGGWGDDRPELQPGKRTATDGHTYYGNVFGGGSGVIPYAAGEWQRASGLVEGSTKVVINGGHILTSVYGGNEQTDVLGETSVEMNGGTVGVPRSKSDIEANPALCYVFGGGKGDKRTKFNTWTNVNSTSVAIKGGTVYGSVYGGGEDGHVLRDAAMAVTPAGSKTVRIGCDGTSGYDGNVFGGGQGSPVAQTAGVISGNVSVNVTGGTMWGSVYGGGRLASVGTHLVPATKTEKYGRLIPDGKEQVVTDDGSADDIPAEGRTHGEITMTVNGGTIKGSVFGAGKGDRDTKFNTWTNVKSTSVTITSANIGGSVFGGGEDGHVLRDVATSIDPATGKTIVIGANDGKDNGNVFGGGQGSTTALTAGVVSGNVSLDIKGGTMWGSVYGGGRLAAVGTFLVPPTSEKYGTFIPDDKEQIVINDGPGDTENAPGRKHGNITVSLTGGTIHGDVFGGGMGTLDDEHGTANILGISKNVKLDLNKEVATTGVKGCVVLGNIFGCNNMNASPKGTVDVHIYATQNDAATQIQNDGEVTNAKEKGRYDVKAVYGGGNMAAYEPAGGKTTTNSTNVIIDGCGLTSIKQVYGGGNAASTPATSVTVNGTYEIEEVFGGGNGKDDLPNGDPNPGANVGFYTYADDAGNAQTPADRAANYGYGTGQASINVFGGTIHRVFGGSNTKGNVRQTAVTLLDENSGCPFCVDEAYGGGKSAPMDAEAKLLMACIPGLQAAYGGAEAAAIQGNVTLNITNGTFDRVFGGNNLSGTINGSITVNVEEVGCKPIMIGELYGGGNQAGYSVYGYDSDGKPVESGTTPLYNDPQVNVKSFTSIGNIFGGGYGSGATMVGNPTVNINEVYGRYYNDDRSVVSEDVETPNHYPIPSHAKGKMGAINNVFGGGNAAKVIGNTNVNIGTLAKVSIRSFVEKSVTTGASVEGLYTRSGEGTEESPYIYTAATGNAVAETKYYEEKDVEQDVLGADIRGNVYGGGNNAEVTGNTNVVIGKKNENQ